MGKFIFSILKILFLLLFPFILLIRGSVYFHTAYEWSPWLATLGGVGVTVLTIFLYLTVFQKMLFKSQETTASDLKVRMIFAVILVLGYALHGIMFFSDANAKSKTVQKEFTSLHPLLRLSTSTILFLDNDLIMTDANRVPEDYRKMGLKSKKRSLHYKQKNGYVHAMDIRTNNRSEFRNFLLKAYFDAMGFNTLRHGGTGDHLHVSLHSHDSPGAI